MPYKFSFDLSRLSKSFFRGLVYKLSKSEVVVDLKGGKVRVI